MEVTEVKGEKMRGLKNGLVAAAAAFIAVAGGQAIAQAAPGVSVTQGQVVMTAEGASCTVAMLRVTVPGRLRTAACRGSRFITSLAST
ncbi:hypothetical protein CU043_05225 [Corynebacterium striatum]|nr:hypothetical protein [Corynebacterium striatum]